MPQHFDAEESLTYRRGDRTQHQYLNSRRVLTLRMLAAQTEWVEGPLRWQEGRIVWAHPRGEKAPTPADLSAAQRALHQVARHPHASDRAFGDGQLWLETRQTRLERAKHLSLLRAPDLSSLVSSLRRPKPEHTLCQTTGKTC